MQIIYGEIGFRINLLSGAKRTREGLSIPAINDLHRTVADHLANDPKFAMNGPEMRFLRTELGLSLEDFASISGVELSAFAAAENAEMATMPDAERLLRLMWLEKRGGLGKPRAIRSFLYRIRHTQGPLRRGERQLSLKYTQADRKWHVAR